MQSHAMIIMCTADLPAKAKVANHVQYNCYYALHNLQPNGCKSWMHNVLPIQYSFVQWDVETWHIIGAL